MPDASFIRCAAASLNLFLILVVVCGTASAQTAWSNVRVTVNSHVVAPGTFTRADDATIICRALDGCTTVTVQNVILKCSTSNVKL